MADALTVHTATMAAVQDQGRVGHARIGVPPNGANDQYAMAVANALVGNGLDAPVVENTLLDLACSVSVETVAAVTGAPATVTVDGDEVPQWAPLRLLPGSVLKVRKIRDGLHVYVALAGTLEVPTLLGSCAPDPLAGFGTAVRTGAELRFAASGRRLRTQPSPSSGLVPEYGSPWRIDVCAGPEADWYRAPFEGSFVVAKESNHVGMRLAGDTPEPVVSNELTSRAVPTGAVEIPRQDEIIVLRRGRGVTAGYPVAAVVGVVGQSCVAQARPGHEVHFRQVAVADAVADRRAQLTTVRSVQADSDRYLTSP